MAQDFDRKVAMVTGAATGIGAATARLLAERGAKVGLVGLQEDLLAGVAEELNGAADGSAIAVPTDVADPTQVEAAVTRIVDEFGGLHHAVNNAAVPGQEADLHEIDVADWARTIGINLSGAFYGMRYQIPHMLAAGGGSIVNIASVNATKPLTQHGAYTASKHGIVGISQSAQLDYVTRNIRINVVSPGVTDTPMVGSGGDLADVMKSIVPWGRMATPTEVGEAVVWALSDQASYLVGQQIIVDGGFVLR
ncbi:SDR family NAD(P)-dependent oxidoreductase [Actinomadura rugatobispora]|uniref:SDR family NAD(P)-dependent oxidoreductase n=1 Tax=Actinomadura rugatobispora TaxID=1994 RepID=A0ABW0ZSA6_9ACTN|nr:SDR family oxidoreductase [Actinomadura rugatobispora]